MLIKLIIALFITLTLSNIGIPKGSIENTILEKTMETKMTILDKSILQYFYNHSGTLPKELDENTLKIMGIKDIDVQNYIYNRISDRKFSLKLISQNNEITSVHSNIELNFPKEK